MATTLRGAHDLFVPNVRFGDIVTVRSVLGDKVLFVGVASFVFCSAACLRVFCSRITDEVAAHQ